MNKVAPAVDNSSLHRTHRKMGGHETASPATGWTGKGKGFAEVLKDQQVQTTLQEQLILTTNWREIMRRFEGSPVEQVGDEVPNE